MAGEKPTPAARGLCPGTSRFCEQHVNPSMALLRIRQRPKHVWFARRVGRLTSVEHNADWYAEIKRKLAADGITNVDYRLVPLDHTESEPERAEYNPMPAYVAVADELPNQSLDLVIVDGHYRTHCIRRALSKIKPGGYLMVDDVNFYYRLLLYLSLKGGR